MPRQKHVPLMLRSVRVEVLAVRMAICILNRMCNVVRSACTAGMSYLGMETVICSRVMVLSQLYVLPLGVKPNISRSP